MAKELTEEQIEKAGERFVGTPDELEYIGEESEVIVIEIEE